MSTGTPRPTFLNSQVSSDTGKAWMSFEESPVHSGANVRQDGPWTSFADAPPQTIPADPGMQMQLTSPGPNFSGQQLVTRVPHIQNTNQQARGKDASILNRTGIGTDGQHPAQLATHPIHPGAQPGAVTHGPGSTISHILRHKSGDADHEQPGDNRTPSSKHHQNDAIMDTRLANMPQQKPVESNPTAENYYAAGGKAVNRASESGGPDPWFVTEEQSTYYRNQFLTMQPNIDGKIDGQTARNFFTKSRLPIPELSHIWELCDMDQDGHLTLLEFCAAFHLVVARKNNYDLPAVLPKTLLPPLRKMCGISHQNMYANRNLMTAPDVQTSDNTPIIDLQRKEETQAPITQLPVTNKSQSSEPKTEEPVAQKLQPNESSQWQTHEKWETFSDRTSSSTNLANFDQSLDHMENLIHPVPLRMTPSKHELHSAKMRKDKAPPKSTDDDEHHGHGHTVPPAHKSLTNPYGPLQNNLSEPDSHTSPRARSSSNSSHSSAGTSDRSLSEIDAAFKTPKLHTSDQEYQSDWSSRPLQPRSASDSSIDSSSMEASVIAREAQGSVPTPPPRPNQQLRATKSDSFEGENQHHPANDVPDSALTISAPTPPPRPQQSIVAKQPEQNEGFADFSQFEKNRIEDSSTKEPETSPSTAMPEPAVPPPEEKPSAKPKPAPRHSREDKSSKQEVKEEISPDKSMHRKAPTKPPRSRIQSVDSAVQEHNKIIKSNSVASPSDNMPDIPEKPSQKDVQSKLKLQQSIRDLKQQNSKLTRLNADLQQELKDVMQSRITVEMSIHHLRPFTQ